MTHSLRILIAAIFICFIPAPANADEPSTVPYFPVLGDPPSTNVIYIEAPAGSFGIRKAARVIDSQVDGLTIISGACIPNYGCIKVTVGDWDTEEMRALTGFDLWAGYTTSTIDPLVRTILLNRETTSGKFDEKSTAIHELGHALGLGHHNSRGAVSINTRALEFHWREIAVLQSWFSQTF